MATLSPELLNEGKDVLCSRNAEDIVRFADRIVSVEPDNWFGLYAKGVGSGLSINFPEFVANMTKCFDNLENGEDIVPLFQHFTDSLSFCLTHMNTAEVKDFSGLGELFNKVNDKLPESDDELIVTPVLDSALAALGEAAPEDPFAAYYALKAMAMTAFRAYVELEFFVDFFAKMEKIGEAIKAKSDERVGAVMDTDRIFLDTFINTVSSALSNVSNEDLDAIEEYWLEHRIDPYLGHIMQAYQMSAAMATSGKLMTKLAKKVMANEIFAFVKVYLSAKH